MEEDATQHSPIIIPILRDIPHPGQGLIAALLYDLEVPDLDARDGEVWDFEFHGDGGTFLKVLF